MRILVGSEKGGSGKSTIATNLVVARAKAGRDVLLLDADPQGSAALWADMRPKELPSLTVVQKHGDLFDTIQSMAERFDDVVIDAGGRDSAELRSAMLAVDLVLVPFKASQFDLWTLDHVADLIRKARTMNRTMRALAVLNMAPAHARATELEAAREMLAEIDGLELAQSVIHDRKAYRDAITEGRGALESADGKARAEIESLAKEVLTYDQI